MHFQQLFFNLHIFFTLLYSALNYIAVGTNDQNRVKNQSDTVIPFDRNRVILTPDNQRQDSTYINASFIEGYHNDESFIITQVCIYNPHLNTNRASIVNMLYLLTIDRNIHFTWYIFSQIFTKLGWKLTNCGLW